MFPQPAIETIERKLALAFPPPQATALANVLGEFIPNGVDRSAVTQVVQVELGEIKSLLRDLVVAQKQTEQRIDQLGSRMDQLAEAQQKTEQRIDQLAVRMDQLAEAQQKTEQVLQSVLQEVGGLSKSAAYALENEAYRQLPALLQSRYDIVLEQRMVRAQLGKHEVNVLAVGKRAGQPIVVVGETKLQLDGRRKNHSEETNILDKLQLRIEAAQVEYANMTIFPILLTHYARPAFINAAKSRGVYVIQSFEW